MDLLNTVTNFFINFDPVDTARITFAILCISVMYDISKRIKYRKEIQRLKDQNQEIRNNLIEVRTKLDKTSNELQEPDQIVKKLKTMTEIETYLSLKLESIFNSFIFNKEVLLTLKKYGSIATDTKQKLKEDFLLYIEFQLTEEEKNILKKRYPFALFKFLVLSYFNTKCTKLELLIIQKIDIDEKEFKDFKLIESLFNGLSNKDIAELMGSLSIDTPEVNLPGHKSHQMHQTNQNNDKTNKEK